MHRACCPVSSLVILRALRSGLSENLFVHTLLASRSYQIHQWTSSKQRSGQIKLKLHDRAHTVQHMRAKSSLIFSTQHWLAGWLQSV
jgi:DNA-binding CsgD family transcriptional regulator